jgi:hypothetical protein
VSPSPHHLTSERGWWELEPLNENWQLPEDGPVEQSDVIHDLLARIAATDRLIDLIVYRLYGLTEEEVAVVEGKHE